MMVRISYVSGESENPLINASPAWFARRKTTLVTLSRGGKRSSRSGRAGEPIEAIADDFDLSVDEVTEVVQREGLLAA